MGEPIREQEVSLVLFFYGFPDVQTDTFDDDDDNDCCESDDNDCCESDDNDCCESDDNDCCDGNVCFSQTRDSAWGLTMKDS